MFRIRRVEKLTPAADWNVTLCWGMSLDLDGCVIFHGRRQKQDNFALFYQEWCEVDEG